MNIETKKIMDIIFTLKLENSVSISFGKINYFGKYSFGITGKVEELGVDHMIVNGIRVNFCDIGDIKKFPTVDDVVCSLKEIQTDETQKLASFLELCRHR